MAGLVPAIHTRGSMVIWQAVSFANRAGPMRMDGRDKPGHDDR
jgi:hypothetical protein